MGSVVKFGQVLGNLEHLEVCHKFFEFLRNFDSALFVFVIKLSEIFQIPKGTQFLTSTKPELSENEVPVRI